MVPSLPRGWHVKYEMLMRRSRMSCMLGLYRCCEFFGTWMRYGFVVMQVPAAHSSREDAALTDVLECTIAPVFWQAGFIGWSAFGAITDTVASESTGDFARGGILQSPAPPSTRSTFKKARSNASEPVRTLGASFPTKLMRHYDVDRQRQCVEEAHAGVVRIYLSNIGQLLQSNKSLFMHVCDDIGQFCNDCVTSRKCAT